MRNFHVKHKAHFCILDIWILTGPFSKALMIFQMSLKVLSDPKLSGATDVLARELRQLGVMRHEMLLNDFKVAVGEAALGAISAVAETRQMLEIVTPIIVAAKFPLKRHGAQIHAARRDVEFCFRGRFFLGRFAVV